MPPTATPAAVLVWTNSRRVIFFDIPVSRRRCYPKYHATASTQIGTDSDLSISRERSICFRLDAERVWRLSCVRNLISLLCDSSCLLAALAVRVVGALAATCLARASIFSRPTRGTTSGWSKTRSATFRYRVTVDPYAAPDGQFVAVAPLLDAIIATVVFVTRGPDAPTGYIERVAALVPPIMGVLAVAAVWALATVAFDRRAGLIAGAARRHPPRPFSRSHARRLRRSPRARSAAVVRHARGARRDAASRFWPGRRFLAGIALGLYLLAWSSGAFFVAILIGVWVALVAFRWRHQRMRPRP